MIKNKKTMCKILSVFLAFLILVQILPLQVLAENIAELLSNQGTADTSVVENTDVSILFEIEEKRDEHTKVYKKSDGTYTAVKTVEPLHYLNDGVWEEINNSMSLNGNLYTNLDNLFNVELPETIDSNENLTVEKDGYTLSFSIDDIEESSAVVENDIVVSDTNIAIADEAIAQTQASVTYNDIAEDTDLQYIVTPNSIKENIIVSNQESVKDTYTFTFETNELDAEKLNDGSIVFKDNNDAIKFRIPRPVMTDSNLAFSYDINVVLIENTDGTITLEYSPSSEWINSSDRSYPITIDPAITVIDEESDFIEDTVVGYNSDNPGVANQNGADTVLTALTNMLTQENSDGTTTIMDSEIYTKIDTEFFKNLGNDIVFTEVQYIAAGMTTHNGKILAREITEDWDVNTVTYNTKPELSNQIIDYYSSPLQAGEEYDNFVYIHFNITGIFNEWFNGKTNNGFAMTAAENTTAFIVINGSSQNTAIVLDYVDMSGYNENYSYHTQSAGRAGTGYVNDFTQQLSVIRDDINIADNNFPVTIGMIYDSATYGKIKSLNYNNLLAYGNNWTPNYLRAYLVSNENNFTYYTETGSTIDFVRSIDDEGNITFSELFSNIYGNHGYELEYHPASNGKKAYYIVNRPDGYIEKFNNDGLMTSVTKLVYTQQVTDDGQSTFICTEQSINVQYEYNDDHYRIDYITDFTGKVYDYVYFDDINENDRNLLSKITYYTSNNNATSPLEVNYTYDENKNLISVTFPDGKSATYTYDTNGNITSITNIDGYRITYEYEENTYINDIGENTIEYTNRVTNVVEQAKNETTYVNGNSITYERLNSNQVKLTDATGDYEIYHFGAFGNLLYTIDNDGNYVMHEDVDSTDETHFASASDYRAFSENLLSNPSFEEVDPNGNLKNWEPSKTTIMQSNDVPALFGPKVLKISSDENESVNIKQTVNIVSGGDYTFSAYVKTDEQLPTTVSEETNEESTTEVEKNLALKVYYSNTQNEISIKTESIETTKGKWERVSVTLEDVPNTIDKLTVEIEVESGNNFYVDGVQLEQSSTASLYNYLSNGSFNKKEVDENGNEEYILDSWSGLDNPDFITENINGKTVNALILPSSENEVIEISQTVTIDGKANDIIRIGGWFKGNYVKSETNNVWLKNIIDESKDPKTCNFTDYRYAQIKVKFTNTKTHGSQIFKIPFNENLDNWQFIGRDFSLSSSFDKATITIHYSNNINSAMLSNIELTKNKIRTTTYNTDDKLSCPCVDCTTINCSCNCEKGTLCYCIQCIRKNKNTKVDNFANMSIGNNYDEIVTSQLLSQRIGDNVTVNYNLSNGLFKTYVDATMNFTSYNYNNSGVLTQISANDNKIDFSYENDRITAIKQNATIYKFNYDSWGQITQISIGDTPIVSYQYDSEEYRDRIIKVTYYNDDSSHSISKFNYDDESNSIIITVNDKEKFTCIFDKNGSLIEIQEKDGRKINYINDEINISDIENNQIYKLEIDSNGSYVETIGESNFTTEIDSLYNSNCEYKNTVKISVNSEKSIIAEAEFDAIGRYYPSTAAQITNNSEPQVAVGTGYEYYDFDTNSSNSTTNNQNFKTIVSETISYSEVSELLNWYTFNYNYDNNNNIIYESICDKYEEKNIYYECYYSYDESNQLVRVNQKSYPIQDYIYVEGNRYNTSPIITPEKSFTCTYEYDKAGNLRYKREYEYTTDETLENHTPINVIVYGYNSNNEWQDQLMSYGSVNIDYDDIGNPISIGDKQLTWNGKQLKTYTDGDKVINYEYDVNGLCHKKTITHDNATETYDYIWSEGKLTGQIYTDSASSKYAIKYVYDLFNAPYGFIISNNNHERMYLYLKNIKGDIIGVINEEGEMVITYEYDAWGKLSHPYADDSDEFANVINILPITYRGYFYDYDIGLYYIQGRYYNPEWRRFINADSTSNLGSTGTALSYNLYAYCENNPVMYVVDNKNTAFSNTINANYLYNKRISKGITGYIDDQGNGIASKLRYGINTIAPFGCGTVATYNALIMLGNRMDICDIIRDYEMNHAYHDGLIGTHGNNIARFFSEKGYDVTITNLENYNFNDDKELSTVTNIVKQNQANILYYKGGSTGHFIALKYNGQDNQGKDIYITYNEDKTVVGKASSIKEFIPNNRQPYMLISITAK